MSSPVGDFSSNDCMKQSHDGRPSPAGFAVADVPLRRLRSDRGCASESTGAAIRAFSIGSQSIPRSPYGEVGGELGDESNLTIVEREIEHTGGRCHAPRLEVGDRTRRDTPRTTAAVVPDVMG